jgi:vancomycin permeability regulator SanA
MIPNLPPQPKAKHFLWNALPRGLALFLGGFSIVNLLGDLRFTNFDANLWWIDLRQFPRILANAFILIVGLWLFAFGIVPPRSIWRRSVTLASIIGLLLAALANCIQFYLLLAHRALVAGLPLPFSLFIATALALILAALLRQPTGQIASRGATQLIGVVVACAALFPLGQMFCFGKTDYRRPADVAVVLGARVYADGRPSDALADRVRTGCRLYQAGIAKKLLFSGGPGDGAIHEADAMKAMAMRLGVRAEDILLDRAGVNTQATVKNSLPIFSQLQASRVIVVSHFYHLPRIKLAYEREGFNVFTVPARESYVLRQLPFNMAREVAALWFYYFRPLSGLAAAAHA